MKTGTGKCCGNAALQQENKLSLILGREQRSMTGALGTRVSGRIEELLCELLYCCNTESIFSSKQVRALLGFFDFFHVAHN